MDYIATRSDMRELAKAARERANATLQSLGEIRDGGDLRQVRALLTIAGKLDDAANALEWKWSFCMELPDDRFPYCQSAKTMTRYTTPAATY